MSGIDDVARDVGVSTATVSRALRGLPGVAEPTRRRILAAATRLEYVASPHAASLATGRTRTVAVVVPYVDRWYFGQVLRGVGEVLAPAGYGVLLYALDGLVERRDAVFASALLRKQVDGVLVVSIVPEPAEVATLAFFGPRVVTVGSAVPGWSAVLVDDVAVGRAATEHLLGLGHRRVALVGSDSPHELGFTAPAHRLAGYRAALADAGVRFRPEWAVPADFRPGSGAEAVRALLALDGPRPTGIVAASDEMAFGVMAELARAGLAVPGDVSVIGVDDHALAEVLGLTTVVQDVVEQGRRAAGALLAAIGVGGGARAATPGARPPERLCATTTLLVRRSTGSPPVHPAAP